MNNGYVQLEVSDKYFMSTQYDIVVIKYQKKYDYRANSLNLCPNVTNYT